MAISSVKATSFNKKQKFLHLSTKELNYGFDSSYQGIDNNFTCCEYLRLFKRCFPSNKGEKYDCSRVLF